MGDRKGVVDKFIKEIYKKVKERMVCLYCGVL